MTPWQLADTIKVPLRLRYRFLMNASTYDNGRAPMKFPTCLPFLNAMTVGSEEI